MMKSRVTVSREGLAPPIFPLLQVTASLLLIFLSSCKNEGNVSVSDGNVIITGTITEDTYEGFIKNLNSNTKELIISSEGGKSKPALKIARIIQKRGIKVTARKLCLSACASYIWMAGSERSVEKNTLLAFHGSALSLVSFYNKAIIQRYRVSKSHEITQDAAAERDLYQSLGIDPQLLVVASFARGLRCLHISERTDGSLAVNPAFDAIGYIPTKSFLESYGVAVSGDNLPKDNADLEAILQSLNPTNPLPYFILSSPPDDIAATKSVLDKIYSETIALCENY